MFSCCPRMTSRFVDYTSDWIIWRTARHARWTGYESRLSSPSEQSTFSVRGLLGSLPRTIHHCSVPQPAKALHTPTTRFDAVRRL